MGKEMRGGTYSLVVYDSDHLPEDLDADQVFDSLRDALQAAADTWYEANKHLAHEPQVF